MSIQENRQISYTTSRIECTHLNGSISTGTGFFYLFCNEGDRTVPALVTNKHVIAGADMGWFSMHVSAPNGKVIQNSHEKVALHNFEAQWILHPNPHVDIAIMPLANVLTQMADIGKPAFFKAIDSTHMVNDEDLQEFSPVEDILMIGYPNGIWDEINNSPISRTGITATPLYLDFENRKEFLIDCACYPGSSGSPIFLYDEGKVRRKDDRYSIGSRFHFVGMLWGGPVRTNQGDIRIVNIPTNSVPIAEFKTEINLGFCLKAELINDFEPILRQKIEEGEME